jgi:adenosine deaminase
MPRRACIAILLLTVSSAWSQTPIETKFAELRKSPPLLRDFLYRMPKGADLHNHLSGAVYAENILAAAASGGFCIDTVQLKIVAAPSAGGGCGTVLVSAAKAQTDNPLSTAMVDALSMRSFVPSSGVSGHDHFFATFDRMGPVDSGKLISEVVQRAADQNESYLELMALSGGGAPASLGLATGLDPDFAVTRQKLESGGKLAAVVTGLRARLDEIESARTTALDCAHQPKSTACQVKVRYIYQVLREFTPAQVFAQVMTGFALAAADPRMAAVNFVQAEDGLTSMRDYHLQMTMVDFAKKIYPDVRITLHAGELWQGLVPPDGLRFHIREAIELGHAERIGHGVDVMFEKDPRGLLRQMAEKHVAVEINLTSNAVILGVEGDRHPFPVYRKFGVPVALSTDDEGVSRSDLTAEYERAVLTYHLTYADLKQLVRNSLEYSFAPGKGYWKSAECAAGGSAPACKKLLDSSEKAQLEADLDDRFAAFEKSLQ